MTIFESARWYDPEFANETASFFREGAAIARSQLFIQHMNIEHVRPPGTKIFEKFQTFFDRCQEGFIISQKDNPHNFKKIMAHLDTLQASANKMQNDRLSLVNLMMDKETEDTTAVHKDLIAYANAVLALGYLRQQRLVSFLNFDHLPDRLTLGELENVPSFWHMDPTPDAAWDLISDLRKNSELLLTKPDDLYDSQILSSAHFFTAAMNIAIGLQ